jgi:hypothetical protein
MKATHDLHKLLSQSTAAVADQITTAVLPHYLLDQIKADTLLTELLPGAHAEVKMEANQAYVTVMTNHVFHETEQWNGVARSLALQLGTDVELRRCYIDPYLTAQQALDLKKLAFAHPEIVSIERLQDKVVIKVIDESSPSLIRSLAASGSSFLPQIISAVEAPAYVPIIFPATILVEFSNHDLISPLTTARQYIIATAHEITASSPVSVKDDISDILAKMLPKLQINLHGHFLYIKAEASREILGSSEFYHLTKLISDNYSGQCAIFMQIVEPTLAARSSISSIDNPRSALDSRNTALHQSVHDYALKVFGTMTPLEVSVNEASGQALIRLAHFESPFVRQLYEQEQLNRPESIADISFTEWKLDFRDLIENSGKRQTINSLQLDQMRNRICDVLGVDPEQESWVDVKIKGNTIVLNPSFRIPKLLRDILQEKLELIPVAVIINNPGKQTKKLSLSDVKALTKLLLPHGPAIQSIDFDRKSRSITVRVSCSNKEWEVVEKSFRILRSQLLLNRIEILPEILPEPLAKTLSRVSSRHKKLFLNSCSVAGDILLLDWYPHGDRLHTSKSAQSLNDEVNNLITHNVSKLKDYRHLNMFTWDPQRASLLEDGYTEEVLGEHKFRIGAHAVNAALIIPEFSRDRFYAYQKGSTFYSDRGTAASMITDQERSSFIQGAARPAISVFVTVEEDGTDFFIDKEATRIELTIVENKHQLFYSNGLSQNSAKIPADLIPTFQRLERIGAAVASSNQHSGQSSRAGPYSMFVSQILEYSNHVIAAELSRHKLPALFQVSEKPSLAQLEDIYSRFPSRLQTQLLNLSIKDIYDDDHLVRQLMMNMLTLNNQLESNHVNLRAFREQVSLDPMQGSFRIGYSPYILANTGARRLTSMIAQHQLNASHGIGEPLSLGEVEALKLREREHRHIFSQLRHELSLFDQIDELAKVARRGDPIKGLIVEIEDDGTPIAAIHLNGNARYFGKVVASPSSKAKLKLNLDKQVDVLPHSYNMIDDKFTFIMTRESVAQGSRRF